MIAKIGIYITALGKTRLPFAGSWSWAGDPPKISVSKPYPTRSLSMRSDTIDGTLVSGLGCVNSRASLVRLTLLQHGCSHSE